MSQAQGDEVKGAAAPDPLLGRRLGSYQLERRLGQGGMGSVYLALEARLERRVALKVLPSGLAAQPEYRERFLREARKAARLDHPNVVQVFDVGEAEGVLFIAMQLLQGGSLQDLLRQRGRLAPAEAARIVRDAARGLARAHREGIIHRDVKPANILLGAEGEVRLGDFGLVKDLAGEGGDQPLTHTGVILGTPHYMAPEQCEGLPDVDHRADLYALGLVLYQALSGVLPAQGSTPLQIISHRLRSDPPPLGKVAPEVPAALVAVVEALLVRRREERLGSADELAARLEGFLAGTGPGPASGGAGPTAVGRPGVETVPLVVPQAPGKRGEVLRATPVATPRGPVVELSGARTPPPSGPRGASGAPRKAPGPDPRSGPATGPQAPPRRWRCWHLACCLLVMGGLGLVALAVAAGAVAQGAQRAVLGGHTPEEAFWPGRQVVVSGLDALGLPDGPTEVEAAGRAAGTFRVTLRPLSTHAGQQVRLHLELEWALPRLVVERDGAPWFRTELGEGELTSDPTSIEVALPWTAFEPYAGEMRAGEVELRFLPR